MLVKLDENLPAELKPLLRRHGHEADTVADEGLKGAPDARIWAEAVGSSRFLITTDLDFSDLRRFQPGPHPGILVLRLHEEGRDRLLAYMRDLLDQNDLNAWRSALVIATDHRIRVRYSAQAEE